METGEFRKVKELRTTYRVFAHFYDDEKKPNRLFADIVRYDCWKQPILPDAYVIMINPGSCRKDTTSKIDAAEYPSPYSVIEAVSDPAMKCVMWLMDSCKLKKVRILNLVDIVNPKYQSITDDLIKNGMESAYLTKSIFSEENADKYKELVSDDACFFIAWGLDKRFDLLKKQALKKIEAEKIVNTPVDGISYKYLKPMNYNQQMEISREYTKQYLEWLERQELKQI